MYFHWIEVVESIVYVFAVFIYTVSASTHENWGSLQIQLAP
jgi:hypothetical protein